MRAVQGGPPDGGALRHPSAKTVAEANAEALGRGTRQRASGSKGKSNETPWDAPVPLGTRQVLPELPVSAFPPWLGREVKAVAIETQTPPDIPGTLGLTILSVTAGGRVEVHVREGWIEPVNLYGAAVAEPGTRKSALFRALTLPLYRAERQLNEASAAARYEAQIKKGRLEAANEQARKAAIEDGSEAALKAAAGAARELSEHRVPSEVQLITGDTSPEECISILDSQGGRLAIMSAEGRIFEIIMGRYSNGAPVLTPFLEGHAGDSLRVNRRGRYEWIERPALTIGVCIQPAVLKALASKERLREQGLLARFLYSRPPDLVGYRDSAPPAVPAQIRTAYEKRITALVRSLAQHDEPQALSVDDAGRKALEDYMASIEPRLRPDGDLYGIRDWASKLNGTVVRIAGLLHVAEHLTDGYLKPIAEDTIQRAIRFGDYYAAHACATFGAMNANPNLELATEILGWLYPSGQRKRIKDFSARDAHRRFSERAGRPTTAEKIRSALHLLEVHGYIRPLPPTEPSPGGGRPPAPRYETNPDVRPDKTDRTQKRAPDQG